MLRLIGVKPISLWFLRETRLLRAFGSKGTSKPDRPPRVPRSESQGKKFPLKPKFKNPESENLDELLASAGISELMARGLSGIPSLTKPGNVTTDQVGSIPQPSEAKISLHSSENKPQTTAATETFADSPLRLLNLLSVVDHKHCRGCGAVFQFEQAHREGYVDLTRLDRGLQKREAQDTPEVSQVLRSLISERTGSGGVSHKLRALKTMSNTNPAQKADLSEEQQPVKELAKEALADGHTEMYSVEDYLNDTIGLENLEHLENLFEDKIVQKDICDRCVHLKNNDVDKVRAVEINLEKIPVNHFVTNLFRKIAKGSVVIVVVDISDLEATIPTPFIEHLSSGNYEIFVVANKVDTLPTTISSEKIKGWLSSRLRFLLPGVELDNEHICITSSKAGAGLKTLVARLKKMGIAGEKKYIHVIGVTNVGKSSVLNALRVETKKFNPKQYRDPFDMKYAQQVGLEFEEEYGIGENDGDLTVSFFPGTTLKSVEVPDIKLGTRVFDTPGLPTKNRVIDHLPSAKIKQVIHNKQSELWSARLDAGGALWLGALARIDHHSGPAIAAIVMVSPGVSVGRYTSQKANLHYVKGFGTELFPTYSDRPQDTKFTKHTVKLNLRSRSSMNLEELSIHGLGVVGFRSLNSKEDFFGEVLTLDLYLPEGVGWSVRPSLLGVKDAAEAKKTFRSQLMISLPE